MELDIVAVLQLARPVSYFGPTRPASDVSGCVFGIAIDPLDQFVGLPAAGSSFICREQALNQQVAVVEVE